MKIEFDCSDCGQTLGVAAEHVGRRVRCTACQSVQTVPGAAPAPPEPRTEIAAEPSPSRPAPPPPEAESPRRREPARGSSRKWLIPVFGLLVLAGVGFGLWMWLSGGVDEDLEHVPSDAVGFVSIRVADIWESHWGEELRKQFGEDQIHRMTDGNLKRIEEQLGLTITDVKRVTVVMMSPKDPEPGLVIVKLSKDVDEKDILEKVFGGRSKEVSHAGQTLHQVGPIVLCALHARLLLIGPEKYVRQSLDDKGKSGPLDHAKEEASSSEWEMALGVNMEKLTSDLKGVIERAPFKGFGPAEQLLTAGEALHAGIYVDFDKDITFRSEVEMKDSSKAESVHKAQKAMIDGFIGDMKQVRDALLPQLTEQAKSSIAPLLEQLDETLKDVDLEQSGSTVTQEMTIKQEMIDHALAMMKNPPKIENVELPKVGLFAPIHQVREAAMRAESQNNLRQIGVAMHNYASEHNDRLPTGIRDSQGKLLLSWRVQIIPYLEGQNLYDQFKLDEPWDSPHNKRLLDRMPRVYRLPGTKLKDRTHYLSFSGEFEGRKAFLGDPKARSHDLSITHVEDGISDTFMAAEADKSVPWTKPEDIPLPAQGAPRAAMGRHFGNGFNVLMVDGSVRFVSLSTITDQTLRHRITYNGGEVVDFP